MGCCKSSTCELSRLRGECDLLRNQLAASTRSKPFTEDTVLLNGILEHLWPLISESVVKSLGELEPSIQLALSKLPSPLNKCSVKDTSHLGTKPIRFLSPGTAWSSETSFTVSATVEWDSNSSITLSFTGASLAIINFFLRGDFTVEFLLVPRKPFPYPPDIRFKIERSHLALAANLAMLHRTLLGVMSQKILEKSVFPNCQGFSLSSFSSSTSMSTDPLDVRHPPPEGLLSLNILVRLNTPGPAFVVETIFGSDIYSSDFKLKAGDDEFQLPNRCLVVRSCLHQQVIVKLRKKSASHGGAPGDSLEKASFFRARIADLIYRTRDGSWSPAFQLEGPDGLQSTANALTMSTQWWPCKRNEELRKDSEFSESSELISVGICSAQVPRSPESVFWVVARLENDLLPARRTGQKKAQVDNKDSFRAQKLAILEKYKMTKQDIATILEDPPQVKWLQSLDFVLSAYKGPRTSITSLTLELWQKAPGKTELKLGTTAVDLKSCCGRQFQKITIVDGSELVLEFRVRRSCFLQGSESNLHPDVGVQRLEENQENHDILNAVNAANAVSAASNALAAVGEAGAGALQVAMDEGILAVGTAYSGLSAAAQAGIEGFSPKKWGFSMDPDQPFPKSEGNPIEAKDTE
eukprot:Skav234224  [mRNA]  locus=scaffold1464:151314:153224:+ [translate_table: standard]